MLSSLQIENVAVIKQAAIDFKDGFNVMTGETGAGKSIIIDSLNAVLGERTSRELIRSGSDYAFVGATFYDCSTAVTDALSEFGITPEDDGTIIIQRKMTLDGKNICKINGISATVSMLKILGNRLVNIHGQLDNQALLSPEFHCSFIDSVAENNALFASFSQLYNNYKSKKSQLDSLVINEEEKLRKLDLLTYQINEIEQAKIRVGEYDELKQKQEFYRNAEKILSLISTAHEALSGGEESDGAVTLGFRAVSSLQNISSYTDDFSELSKNVEEAVYNLSAFADELRDKLDSLDFDESDINLLEERLDVLYNLFKKYGGSEEAVLDFYNDAVSQRDAIENNDVLREKLGNEVDELKLQAQKKAAELSQTRKNAAKTFSDSVCEVLKFLDMPSVSFKVNIDETPLCENGIDNVEFFLSANLGEEAKPLAKIASGGELSRIMLAIKSVLAGKDNIGTLVFDEIDAGVSGRAALKIAMKLKEVSVTHQVICVTHLAQIAAYADEHKLIEKSEKDGHTYTDLKSLDYIGRKYELARIMGGLTVTESQLAAADELLTSAGAEK